MCINRWYGVALLTFSLTNGIMATTFKYTQYLLFIKKSKKKEEKNTLTLRIWGRLKLQERSKTQLYSVVTRRSLLLLLLWILFLISHFNFKDKVIAISLFLFVNCTKSPGVFLSHLLNLFIFFIALHFLSS